MTQTPTPALPYRIAPVIQSHDCGDGPPRPRTLPPRLCTGVDGNKWPSELFVPEEPDTPNPLDELGGFRVVQTRSGIGCLFAARVTADTNDGRHPVGSLIVFDWEAKPKDGDLVCVCATVKEYPDSPTVLAIQKLAAESNHYEKLFRRLKIPLETPQHTAYLFRRYVGDAAGFRLEKIDGTGPGLANTNLVELQVYAVATACRPWGWHREVVMV